VEFLAGILFSVQSGNWQRGGGKGSKPKAWKRPREFSTKGIPRTKADLIERQRSQAEHLRKRREDKRRSKGGG